jgi:hypothetical protein
MEIIGTEEGILTQSPLIHFENTLLISGGNIINMGGQGKRPTPRPKIRGSQDRNRREKRIIPQPPQPPRQPKK